MLDIFTRKKQDVRDLHKKKQDVRDLYKEKTRC